MQQDLVQRRKGDMAWVLSHPGPMSWPMSYGEEPGPPPSLQALPREARYGQEALMWITGRIFPHPGSLYSPSERDRFSLGGSRNCSVHRAIHRPCTSVPE